MSCVLMTQKVTLERQKVVVNIKGCLLTLVMTETSTTDEVKSLVTRRKRIWDILLIEFPVRVSLLTINVSSANKIIYFPTGFSIGSLNNWKKL